MLLILQQTKKLLLKNTSKLSLLTTMSSDSWGLLATKVPWHIYWKLCKIACHRLHDHCHIIITIHQYLKILVTYMHVHELWFLFWLKPWKKILPLKGQSTTIMQSGRKGGGKKSHLSWLHLSVASPYFFFSWSITL